MADESVKLSGEISVRDMILGALALIDERGVDENLSIAMAIVHEGFKSAENGESVGHFELFQRGCWIHGASSRELSEEED